MQGRVDFEFRTTLMKELHTVDDMRAIGEWLAGKESFFLQTYRDEGDLIVGGFTPFTAQETKELLEVLREYIPNAEIR
jgi:pyruvate formate lyase activating enzyme